MSNTIGSITKKYYSKISPLELEILISFVIEKTREFVLAHPEYTINEKQNTKLKALIERRINKEPIAYITGHKEFYSLDFKVNNATLVPRPETELIVDLLRNLLRNKSIIIDIGTGSGNIIISTAKNSKLKNIEYFGIDISQKALKIAKGNAKKHGVDKKIKFLQGDLFSPLSKKLAKLETNELIIVANLPYLSRKIYSASPEDVRKYEPKTALYSKKHGLDHYERLLKQIDLLIAKYNFSTTVLLEISPEQKKRLTQFIKKLLPDSKIKFHKDLAKKWRICEIKI